MILKHIHLYNFKKYKKASVAFTDSMVGIFGNNGAGKSSLFEAITWCLYGVAQSMEGKEGVAQQDLIRDGQEEMGVEVEFSLGGHLYKVTRYLHAKKGIKCRLWVDGKLQTQKSREVVSRIEQDLGLNVKGFISSSFIRQKELDLITSTIASERKKLVNRLFNLRVYEQFEEVAKERKKEKETDLRVILVQKEEREKMVNQIPEVEKELKELGDTVSVLTNEYEEVKRVSGEVKKEYEDLEKEYRHYQELQSSLKLVEKDIENGERMREEKEGELREIVKAEERKEGLKNEYANFVRLREKLSQLDNVKLLYDAKVQQLHSLETEVAVTQEKIEERIRDHNKEIEELRSEEVQLKESNDMLATIREKLVEYEDLDQRIEEETQKLAKVNEKEIEITSEKAQYAVKLEEFQKERAELQSIGVGAPCPKCKRPLEKDHLEKLIAKYNTEMDGYQKLKEKCETRETHLTQMKSELENGLKILREKEKERSELQKQEQRYAEAGIRLDHVRKKMGEAEAKMKEEEGKSALLNEKKKGISTLQNEIGTLGFDPSDYEKVKKEVEEKKEIEREMIKLEERMSKKNEVMTSIEEVKTVLEGRRKERENMASELESLSEIPAQFEEVKKRKDAVTAKELEISREYTEAKTRHELREKELEKLKESIRELESIRQKQKETETLINVYVILQDAFKQIPVQIQSRLGPRIRKETSELLNEVTEGKYPFINLEKDYSLTVYYDGTYYPISRFSGGEKDLINLCLRVGISRVLVSLSSQKSFARVQSLFLDECFGSFDTERRKNLLLALNELRKYFAQIVLITHIEEIKEALPEAFLVEELEDGSSIVKKIK